MITTTLIDRRNAATEIPRVVEALRSATFIGLDCETHDDGRHEGLNLFMKVNEETRKKAGNKKLVFDHRRTVMTGFSVYPEGCDRAWYVNLAHADVENRLTWEEVKPILEAKPANGFWLSHNATFEVVMFLACHGIRLTDIICTMQLSVTAFGDDNYDIDLFRISGLNGLEKWPEMLLRAAMKGSPEPAGPVMVLTPQARADLRLMGLEKLPNPDALTLAYRRAMKKAHPDQGGTTEDAQALNAAYDRLQKDELWEEAPDEEASARRFNREVDDMIGKICAKEADSAHSYNGYVYDLAYGHGLKQLVKVIFGHEMGTFKETLGENAHMGQLTGDQVVGYGAEDAYWVVPLFRWLMEHIAKTSPDALPAFFAQENPMIQVYADLWLGGMVVDREAIEARRNDERAEYARLLRNLRAALKQLPWQSELNEGLAQRQDWYAKNGAKYRGKIQAFANREDEEDDFLECMSVKGAVSTAWAEEAKAGVVPTDFSVMHYMPVRVILYDLLGARLQFDMGKLASDGEARGKVKNWLEVNDPDPNKLQVLDCLAAMASLETRMKLYLSPYMLLTDPETQRMYPTVSSLLNTRRLAASTPNAMQLAKRGESTYVRGFFKGDRNPGQDDHMIVSIDWSAIELVIIGELSKDPEFHVAFGQRPHEDLHTGATVSVLGVEMPWLTVEQFKNLRAFEKSVDFCENYSVSVDDASRLFTNLKGEPLSPGKARSYWRTEVGKGANFNYWYSGFLTTVGQRLGWNLKKTAMATDLYRERFSVAEDWRMEMIDFGRTHGYVQLPDGHRRFRYEATFQWLDEFKAKWPQDEMLDPIVHEIARRIHKRAHNQLINALVQGTCATIMKRSTLRMRSKLLELGWTQQDLARFMIPIHDEKVYSVHPMLVPDFIKVCRGIMLDHDDLFPTLKLDASPAVGVTFEPWDIKKAPTGQVELFEPPEEIVGKARAGKPLDDDGIREVVDYLRGAQLKMAA